MMWDPFDCGWWDVNPDDFKPKTKVPLGRNCKKHFGSFGVWFNEPCTYCKAQLDEEDASDDLLCG